MSKETPIKIIPPQPSRSDEERAREIASYPNAIGKDQVAEILALVAAVRAEATLAGAAAEREAIEELASSIVDNGGNARGMLAAIRARKS